MKIIAAALAAAILVTGTGVTAKPVEKVQVRVSTAGINFNDPDSVAQFRQRVERQIAAACNPGDRLNADMSPDFACRKSMTGNAEVRIAALQTTSNSRMATLGE